ncbi:MAG: heparinase II/III family protein [Alistipes sp.]|nr:heparinase II/III family protein [Alistipes sp.]
MKKLSIFLLFSALMVVGTLSAQSLDYDKLTPHPRLLLKSGDITAMRALPARSATAKVVHDRIIAESERVIGLEPVERVKVGKRMIAVSREALKRIFYLSYAYLTTEDIRYAQRAEREMLAISEFEDWNPVHFLDVGEMTMAMAIGYDWLYRYLPIHSRSIIGTAIYEKGLMASEKATFFNQKNIWNPVCNAGMIYGALATMERSPEYCRALIGKCMYSVPKGLDFYNPDGSYIIGYNFWGHGTGFEVMLVAALQSALGTDAGIAAHEAFMRTASFMNYLVAPSGKVYNYSDAKEEASMLPVKYWFARQTKDTSLVAMDERMIKEGKVGDSRLLPVYMLFASSLDLSKPQMPKSTTWSSGGEIPMYIYRSGWDKTTDTYLAVKGGRASSPHGHMDAGAFVFERDGVRWAVDLGEYDEHTLEQAGVGLWNLKRDGGRWDVFRFGPESHNTLMFNGERHNVEEVAPIVETFNASRHHGAVVDLTPTFKGMAQSVKRTVELDKNNNLVVTDNIVGGPQPSKVEWRMATNAEAEIIAPNIIQLKQDGKTMYLRLRTRATADAVIWPEHQYKEYEERDENLRRVGFIVDLRADEPVDVEVTLSSERGKKSITLPKLKLNLGKKNRR